ncbi:hypothetical protein PHLCEN_2v3285 [Hermanssonia centrifuga]|uniref:Uncharacterized protein n=1 Tax=Hermanssonia centrifuga TaxID=98765 RepID=A0A2R6QUJ7_9APHY|nr:hypothetical protein PHLCEN_2v3285 [Hermanssonia centrifuga]
MTGYLAFPPPRSSLPHETRTPLSSVQEQAASIGGAQTEKDVLKKSKEEAQAKQREIDEERRIRNLEREQREVYVSELAWVRSGGILRDANGRRDKVRTEKMRKEIRILDEEKRILDCWNAYESRWHALLASNDSICWKDIPWPVCNAPSSVADLAPELLSAFLFAPFKVRGQAGSRKERIRSSILRWHPDKISIILARVVDEERDLILQGVNTVVMSLRALQDAEKAQA